MSFVKKLTSMLMLSMVSWVVIPCCSGRLIAWLSPNYMVLCARRQKLFIATTVRISDATLWSYFTIYYFITVIIILHHHLSESNVDRTGYG
jgi:hypothetical protein